MPVRPADVGAEKLRPQQFFESEQQARATYYSRLEVQMRWTVTRLLPLVLAVGLFAAAASADQIPIGFISFDVTGLNTAQFDITNETGPNSTVFPDTSFPVTTSVSLSNLVLTVDGVTQPSTYFTLSGDGLSWDGSPLSTLTAITSATLTGTFSTTSLTLNDGSTDTILPTFSVTITGGAGKLEDQDSAIIYATTSSGPPPVPEPGTWLLMGTGLAIVLYFGRRHWRNAQAAGPGLFG
jgi:hypothetical protein